MVLAKLLVTYRRMRLDQQLSSQRNSNSKWIRVFGLKYETPELLEENTGNAFEITGTVQMPLVKTPVAQEIGPRINKWSDMRLKCFSTEKKTIIRENIQPTEWEKIFCGTSDMLMSTIYKELNELNSKKGNSPLKNAIMK